MNTLPPPRESNTWARDQARDTIGAFGIAAVKGVFSGRTNFVKSRDPTPDEIPPKSSDRSKSRFHHIEEGRRSLNGRDARLFMAPVSLLRRKKEKIVTKQLGEWGAKKAGRKVNYSHGDERGGGLSLT